MLCKLMREAHTDSKKVTCTFDMSTMTRVRQQLMCWYSNEVNIKFNILFQSNYMSNYMGIDFIFI